MKNKKLLIFISILIIISAVIILIVNKNAKEQEKESFSFVDIVEEVNFALSEVVFREVLDNEIIHYIPISNIDNLFLAINDVNNDEYFLIGRNLDNYQKSQLESMYSKVDDENFKFYSDEKYVYFIKSEAHLYMIEGIINSFIYNY